MSPLAPIMALVGVIIGAGLSYVFTTLTEKRREQWALGREWREQAINLIGGPEVVDAGRDLNRAVWDLEWFARGSLDDADRAGWTAAFRRYHVAIDIFHDCARRDLGVTGTFSPRPAERSPRARYEADRP